MVTVAKDSSLMRFGRWLALLGGLGGTAGGTLYVADQRAQDALERNREVMEKRLSDSEMTFHARLGLEREKSDGQVKTLNDTVDELTRKNDDADALIRELTQRLDTNQSENSELGQRLRDSEDRAEGLAKSLDDLKGDVTGKVSLYLPKAITAKSGPSSVNISAGPNDKYRWSGTIMRDLDGKRYLLTCGHSWNDVTDFLGLAPGDPNGGRIKIEGNKGLYKFEIVPGPLPNGVVGFSPSHENDVAIFPIPEDVNKMFDRIESDRGVNIGLGLGDLTKEFEDGQLLAGNGNPRGRASSLYFGFLINPEQGMAGALKQPRLNYGFLPGNSGMGLVGEDGFVEGMAISVSPDYVATANIHGKRHLKIVLEGFGVPVMRPNEKEFIEREKALIMFGDLFSNSSNPLSLAGSLYRNKVDTPPLLDKVIRPLSGFMLPTPHSQLLPLWNYLPKGSKK